MYQNPGTRSMNISKHPSAYCHRAQILKSLENWITLKIFKRSESWPRYQRIRYIRAYKKFQGYDTTLNRILAKINTLIERVDKHPMSIVWLWEDALFEGHLGSESR